MSTPLSVQPIDSQIARPALTWDIFCRVIDNFGDVGVCWRLASQLAESNQRVRLWLDDASALAWLAPAGCPGVGVFDWPLAGSAAPGDVVIEAFGCDAHPDFIAAMRMNSVTKVEFDTKNTSVDSVWINLEYLSAEDFVTRNHLLPSPQLSGPGCGMTKTFFYPGFTPTTGGLLREPDLEARQAHFDRDAWLNSIDQPSVAPNERLMSLFCYEPAPLAQWLFELSKGADGICTRLLVCAGRPTHAVHAALQRATISRDIDPWSPNSLGSMLFISYLPTLTQLDYDHLLWACDFNCVRGEDSLIRAIWAGKPMLWHIYPQDDNAHHAKLAAFLTTTQASPNSIAAHRAWCSVDAGAPIPPIDWASWARQAKQARNTLASQPSLVDNLLAFVNQKRSKSKALLSKSLSVGAEHPRMNAFVGNRRATPQCPQKLKSRHGPRKIFHNHHENRSRNPRR